MVVEKDETERETERNGTECRSTRKKQMKQMKQTKQDIRKKSLNRTQRVKNKRERWTGMKLLTEPSDIASK